jgi:hypothetical protein
MICDNILVIGIDVVPDGDREPVNRFYTPYTKPIFFKIKNGIGSIHFRGKITGSYG